MRPTSSSGWCTVVSAGTAICDTIVSSKPTTERSSGTRIPRARASWSTATAISSLQAKMAVGRSGQIEELRRGRPSLDGAELSVRLERRVGPDPGRGQRRAVTARPVLGCDESRNSLDEADPPVTEPEQVLGRLDRAGHVRRGDEREVAVERVALVRDDEREARCLQLQEVVGRLVGEHEDRAVDLPLEQLVDEGELPLLMVERGAQDGLHVELVERLREAR